MKHYFFLLLFGAISFLSLPCFAQQQTCPANINFATGDLSFWSARTGLVGGLGKTYPGPNGGVVVIPEYSISTTGVQVLTSSSPDRYGNFPSIPTINGYAYDYSVKIGSTATSYDLQSTSGRNPGGFTRAITYTINVPSGPADVPYTMTYAYAMVLENGTHNSNEQPLFKATLSTKDSIISCASPQYYLPTLNNSNNNGTGATLDTAAALRNGFTNSPVPFLSHTGNAGNGILLYDVWTKGWTEVTFDLSPFRGQQVTLTFESDNCTPGAHFAYAYVALRNMCAGLEISGDATVCANSTATYSIPSLANGIYEWQVPAGWTINSGASSNIIEVTAGTTSGYIVAHEINGCADLKDTLFVQSRPPTVAGSVIGNTTVTVCSGTNSASLSLSGQVGTVVNWLYSTDGINWNTINAATNNYTPNDLTATTQYKALVQNGSGCSVDTSAGATILVDPKSVAGILNPENLFFCAGQNTNSLLTLTANKGSVINWQVSNDSTNWNSLSPAFTGSSYTINSINTTSFYRTIVKNGVCPADTSKAAVLHFVTTPFPAATIDPAVSTICYGASAELHANITVGTSYSWSPAGTLKNQGNGTVSSLPYSINATASPLQPNKYILTVTNAGCPNVLTDTFTVKVMPKIIVNAGKDTSVLSGQSAQLDATTNDSTVNQFSWSPPVGLNSVNIKNPVATLSSEAGNSVTYTVRAINALGCSGEDYITVRIFNTGIDIFVPSAFTPNGDGKNDIVRPICVGIKQLNYFRIYNRWGELVYSTNEMEGGWDGIVKGKPQPTGNFVFIVEGIDNTGRKILKKGTVLLIR